MGQCTSSDADQEPGSRTLLKALIREFPNIDFYRGDYPIALHSPIIFHLKHWANYTQQHQYLKFYQDLESDKTYMQWLYPNFFQSFMNTNSFRLTPKERNLFIANEEIMKVYRQNSGMFLRYIGISRNEEKKLEIVDDSQLEQCLFVYTHNLNRIQRFLSSLSVLGMREEALEFLNLLQQKLTRKHKLYIQKFQVYEQLSEEKGLESTQTSDPSSQKVFSDLKSNYVQSDLIEEPWVTVKILTLEPIEMTESANAEKKNL